VAAFDAHEDGEFSGGVGGEDVLRGEAEGEVVGAAADLFADGVDEGEGAVGEAAGQAEGSGQMAKISAARLPARAEARLRWPVDSAEARGEVKSQDSSRMRWGVSAWVSMRKGRGRVAGLCGSIISLDSKGVWGGWVVGATCGGARGSYGVR
jgi:hypothetical protein